MSRISRRSFLAGAGGLAVGAGAFGAGFGVAAGTDGDPPTGSRVPFHGAHQAGITADPTPARGLAAAFTVLADDRAHLTETFRELSDEVEGLMDGRPIQVRDPAYPPTDSGILGPDPPPDDLSVIVSVGASLFDEPLRARRPQARASWWRCRSWRTTGSTPTAPTATCC